jgi:hypothetical protein
VSKARRRDAQRLVYENLFVRIGQMILPAYDVRDPHLYVVNHDRKVIERVAVGPEQHEVFYLRIIARLLAVDDIGEKGFSFLRDFQANCEGVAAGSAPVRVFLRQLAVRIAAMIHAFCGSGARPLGYAFLDARVGTLHLRREIAVGATLFY